MSYINFHSKIIRAFIASKELFLTPTLETEIPRKNENPNKSELAMGSTNCLQISRLVFFVESWLTTTQKQQRCGIEYGQCINQPLHQTPLLKHQSAAYMSKIASKYQIIIQVWKPDHIKPWIKDYIPRPTYHMRVSPYIIKHKNPF